MMMKVTELQMKQFDQMSTLLTALIFNQDTSPIERTYLAEIRTRIDAVRAMPVTPCD